MEQYKQLKQICNTFLTSKITKAEFTEKYCEITGKKPKRKVIRKPRERNINWESKEERNQYMRGYRRTHPQTPEAKAKAREYDKKYNRTKRRY